jgi:membrane protease YdiL (CAAX protease family)
MWNDILFQLTLVAPAEELSKLVVMLAIYLRMKGAFGESMSRLVALLVPISFWSLMHVYRNPEWSMVTIVAAVCAGLIMYGVMYKTKNLLGAILTHAGYNIIVILMMVAG